MVEPAVTAPGGGEELVTLTRRKHWGKRLATELLVLLLVLLSLAVGGLEDRAARHDNVAAATVHLEDLERLRQ
ncbi:MAG TPA: hypothetical protein VFR60_09685, partial [Sphingomicrobium sp.]|nr:hypothetical protein [Sphingomicrobium sp.]